MPAQSCPTLATPRTAACQASPSFIVSQSLLKLMYIDLMMLSNSMDIEFEQAPGDSEGQGSLLN